MDNLQYTARESQMSDLVVLPGRDLRRCSFDQCLSSPSKKRKPSAGDLVGEDQSRHEQEPDDSACAATWTRVAS